MRRATHTARGFTIIEMLVALVVTMIGFAAIFQLQIGTMQGNISARELAAATNLAERYAEVLHRDAHQWTGFDKPGPWLNQAPRVWHSFTPAPIDHNGRAYIDDDDQGSPLSRQRFCVHYWFDEGVGPYDGVLTGRVRVVWPRNGLDRDPLYEICGENDAAGFEPAVVDWFTLTVPVAIRRHPG